PLVAAAAKEPNPKALEAMLLTLGESGAPEAKPAIVAHVDDKDADLRRAAHKAMKRWQAKNGQVVRKDVETRAPAPAAAASASAASPATPVAAPPPPDGCQQFKDICGADPFNLEKCRQDMQPLSYAAQQAWADCVNESADRCQKAHTSCMAKIKSVK